MKINHHLPMCSHYISKCEHVNTSGGSSLKHTESFVEALYCVGIQDTLLLTMQDNMSCMEFYNYTKAYDLAIIQSKIF